MEKSQLRYTIRLVLLCTLMFMAGFVMKSGIDGVQKDNFMVKVVEDYDKDNLPFSYYQTLNDIVAYYQGIPYDGRR